MNEEGRTETEPFLRSGTASSATTSISVSVHPTEEILPESLIDSTQYYRVYGSRWYMLAVLAVVNFSNGMIWMSFSNIADSVSAFYVASTFQVDMLSIVFMLATLILGIPVMWLLDKHGLKLSFIIAAWTNFLGAALRVASSLYFIEKYQHSYALLVVGQTLSGCAQPFVMFASTKLVALWFSSNERTVANTIGSLANPLGFSIGGLLSALMVTEANDIKVLSEQLTFMLEIMTLPAFIGAIMTIWITSARPPTMPSPSASHEIEPFVLGLKMLRGYKSYILLSICYGAGVGIISSLVTIVDQLLLPRGYSNIFAAVSVCLFIGFGLIGSFVASVVADKTKSHEAVAKVQFSIGAIFLIVFLIFSYYPNQHCLLLVLLSLSGFFCLSVSPICLELSVESSYPVAVGTSSGILVIFGQIMSALFTLLLSIGSQPITHSATQGDIINEYSLAAYMVLTFLTVAIFVIFFNNPMKRVLFEMMTPEILKELSEEESKNMTDMLFQSHEHCVCRRQQNMQRQIITEVF